MAPENDPSFRPDQAACGVAAPCSVTRAPPLVRALSQPMPATGSGRDAMPGPAPGDRPVLAAVAPRPPAGGRARSPAARLPPPGLPGRGYGTGAAVTCAFTAMARLPPPALASCCAGPAAARSRSCGDGHPRQASQAPSHVRPCRYRCGLSFGIEDSVAHAANLRRGIYVGKLQPAWRPFCRFLAVSG